MSTRKFGVGREGGRVFLDEQTDTTQDRKLNYIPTFVERREERGERDAKTELTILQDNCMTNTWH